VCHCPPPVADSLTVTDFARLTAAIDQAEAAAAQGG